jgi:hypothetical protein
MSIKFWLYETWQKKPGRSLRAGASFMPGVQQAELPEHGWA